MSSLSWPTWPPCTQSGLFPRGRTVVLVLVMVFVLVLTRWGTSADAAVSLAVMLLAAITGRAWPDDPPSASRPTEPR